MNKTELEKWKDDLQKVVRQWNKWHYQMHLYSLDSEKNDQGIEP